MVNSIKSFTHRQLLFFPFFFVLYEMISFLSNDAYLPAMPLIQDALHTTDDLVRLSLTSWFFGGCLIQLAIGPLSDYFGRRKIMLLGGIVFVISSIGCALSTHINMLIFMRLIEGSTIATMAVSGYATIHEMYDTKKSIQILAFMNSISVLAPALGPLVGALILMYQPWPIIFYGLGFSAIIPLLLLYWDMPETAPIKQGSLNFKAICGRYKRIMLNRSFVIYMLSSRTLFSALIVWLSAGPFLLSTAFNMDPIHFGYAQTFIFGAFIVGTRANKALMERFDLSIILWQGWAACILGAIYCLIYAGLNINNFYPILPGLMLITFGSGISLPIYSRLAIESSNEPMGEKVAMTTFSMTLFGTLATLIINMTFTDSLWSIALILAGFIFSGFILFSVSHKLGWINQ
tara:strand:- start:95 stop:1306 length:1212 start_codon:yes stop_codon:yes gene_type:complete